jgi:hypothetical protein
MESVPMAEAPSRATWHVHTDDIITSTVRPIRRLTARIAEDQDGAVCSSGFVVLSPRTVESEVLLTNLRLNPICKLLDLHTSASMYPAISERAFKSVAQPVAWAVIKAVRASSAARNQAQVLRDGVKRAVEIAIESGEVPALQHLLYGK